MDDMSDDTETIHPDYLALVGDHTPESLLYGDYRGWVALDDIDGAWCYVADLSDDQVEAHRGRKVYDMAADGIWQEYEVVYECASQIAVAAKAIR